MSSEETRTIGRLADNSRQLEARHFGLISEDLTRLATRRLSAHPHCGLAANDLVSELYERLTGREPRIADPVIASFLASAAPVVREALVRIARRQPAVFRDVQAEFFCRLDAALSRLAESDATLARLIELRFFAGMTNDEAAHSAGVPVAQAPLLWDLGRARLKLHLPG